MIRSFFLAVFGLNMKASLGVSIQTFRQYPVSFTTPRRSQPSCCTHDQPVDLIYLEPEKLERLAEAYEAAGNISGAVDAYSALLKLQPPTCPSLGAETSARRGLQELLLLSLCSQLEAGEPPAEKLSLIEQAKLAGEASREQLTRRALTDVAQLRSRS